MPRRSWTAVPREALGGTGSCHGGLGARAPRSTPQIRSAAPAPIVVAHVGDASKPAEAAPIASGASGAHPAKRPSRAARKARRRRSQSGRRLFAFDREIGSRWVAGADEAGRGSLAGPLVAAAVLFDL